VATDYDKTDVAHDDDVHIVATLDGKQIQAGYNRPGDYNRQAEIDPLNMQYVNDKVADVTNSAAATSNYYLDLNGFKRMSAQLEITSGSGTVTVKFFGTVEDDDPDAEFWGCFTAVKINVVIVNASADSSYRIDTKRHY
jgi:hypothetical protein